MLISLPHDRFNGSPESPLQFVKRQLDILRHLAEGANRKIALIDETVSEIVKSGLLPRTALLGDVVQQRDYPPTLGGNESGEVLQIAILIPGGVGILSWDSEEFAELQLQADGLESEAWTHFVPFRQCEPAAQGLAAREIDRLILRLIEALHSASG